VGEDVYAEWNADFDGAFAGNVVHREYLHKLSGDKRTRLLLQFLPQFNESGTVIRAFVLATDISDGNDASLPVEAIPSPAVAVAEVVRPSADMAAEPDDALDSDAVRLRTALARNEFCLFFQTIEPVVPTGEALPFREILLRLKLEEERMMPPGSFLPVAEEHNMLPDLDRWVVNQLLAWICADAARQQGVYSVNIAAQTVMDTAFPAFVKKALNDFGLPGSLLCFELQEAGVLESRADSIRFVAELKAAGCRNILCGFSGNRESLDLLRQVQVNFVKIDGSLILKMIRSGVDLARVKAIQRVARVIGISTIAECVEDNATIKLLKDIGVNFAQGFGISRPQDIRNISGDVAVEPGTDSAAIDREVAMAGR
jgi:EAL domain-containing protein (putative c-di-GMP-specific phosphodiesterase class I)